MSKFNQKAGATYNIPNTTNLAGGSAFTLSHRNEIVTILLTSFLKDGFYRSADVTVTRLQQLIGSLQHLEDIEFVAKAVVYARTVFGMRSITHVAAVELSKKLGGLNQQARSFYNRVVYRPDDMTEMLSYMKVRFPNKKGRVPNYKPMQKGFALALARFSDYSLAKYRGEGNEIKLVDVANWCHPAHSETIQRLMKGELKQTETWEALLSAAGSDPLRKANAWEMLLAERKIGYLALLRNLRNILQQAPKALPNALASLTDENFIRKSLILPFQYMTAYEEFEKIGGPESRIVMTALSKAVDISLGNVPAFEGDTLVVVDVSGSMAGATVAGSKLRVSKVAAMFGAVIAKRNNADFMVFSDDAEYYNYAPLDTTLTVAKNLHFRSGGTAFASIFARAKRKYDRIIVLSDMQGWAHGGAVGLASEIQRYRARTGAGNFRLYSFDLAGYGTLQVHENRTFLMAGFSDKTMQIMQYLEKDPKALETEINKVDL